MHRQGYHMLMYEITEGHPENTYGPTLVCGKPTLYTCLQGRDGDVNLIQKMQSLLPMKLRTHGRPGLAGVKPHTRLRPSGS